MKKITMYTTATCMYCKMAKEFFREHNLSFDEKDVGQDAAAREEMLNVSGQMGVPVIVVEGEQEPIVGFDKRRLVEALGVGG